MKRFLAWLEQHETLLRLAFRLVVIALLVAVLLEAKDASDYASDANANAQDMLYSCIRR